MLGRTSIKARSAYWARLQLLITIGRMEARGDGEPISRARLVRSHQEIVGPDGITGPGVDKQLGDLEAAGLIEQVTTMDLTGGGRDSVTWRLTARGGWACDAAVNAAELVAQSVSGMAVLS